MTCNNVDDKHTDDETNYPSDKLVTATDIEDVLTEIVAEAPWDILVGSSVDTFSERGILTDDKGIVLRLATGDEFHVTIVQSARA